ncbi:MAG: DsbA family protein [Halieaceae bacterium]
MAEQFSNMGGSSHSEPSLARRWLTSVMMRRFSDQKRMQRMRQKCEQRRQAAGEAHKVEYFHQVEDPYSYLMAQVLPALLDRYDIELQIHLVSGPPGDNASEPDLLLPYSQMDCAEVAPYYGLSFPRQASAPEAGQIELAMRILAAAEGAPTPARLLSVSAALWSSDAAELQALAASVDLASADTAAQRLEQGNQRRQQLGHYSGAMLFYGKEWYWGVDRLYHLENRLRELGATRAGSDTLLMPRPAIEAGGLRDDGSLTLEIFPSLRSPYSSFIFDHAMYLAEATGVRIQLRPVLPMVMRGAAVTRLKGQYIMFDTGREAAQLGPEWGNAWDPIGEPVRRAFALFPWAESQGKGAALLSAFMHGAFYERVKTHRLSGLRKIVTRAGLSWEEARQHLQDTDWQEPLEQNRLQLYRESIWGVPSFRLLGANGDCLLSTWGADRLWLVARRIEEHLLQRQKRTEL